MFSEITLARRSDVKIAFWAAIITVALIFLYKFNPASFAFYPPCIFHLISGLHCPGCGSLRAIHQLLRGNLAGAFGLNPLIILSLPFLGYALFSRFKKEPLPNIFTRPFWAWLLLGIVISYWILRNIPIYPFVLLAPK